MVKNSSLQTIKEIQNKIYFLRGQRVMLDFDLAELYGVETRSLIQGVKRNQERFPSDFIFPLNNQEVGFLRSQNVISKEKGGRRYLPHAFTEQGVAMLSGVLRSKTAVQVNIEIMRTFVRIKHWMLDQGQFAKRLDELEGKYDGQFKFVFEALRELMTSEDVKTKPLIGFERDS